MNRMAAVVVPFYKINLSAYEQIALDQCFKVLAKHSIIAVKPEKLTLPAKVAALPFSDVVSFEDKYFDGVEGYNELMLSSQFYERFHAWEYILIYQLDAFVFADQLDYWCRQDYDYIGAPWLLLGGYKNIFDELHLKIKSYLYVRYNAKHKNGLPKLAKQLEGRVGNGGFSLRRIEKFISYCHKYKPLIDEYIAFKHPSYNEDIFWSIELNRKKQQIKKPSFKKALQFAFEVNPARAFKINHHRLPFGCHAWDKNADFWRQYFKQSGYEI